MKYFIAFILLVAPWIIFLWAAKSAGTSAFALVLTLAVSAFGFMLLISRDKR
jgi:hypothetical protein